MNPEWMIAKLQELPRERGLQILPDRRRARMRCQWHRLADGSFEKTPSFFINIVDNGKYKQGSGHCFGCRRHVSDFHAILDPSKEGQGKPVDDEADDYVRPFHADTLDDLLFGTEKPVYDLRAALDWNPAEAWRTIPGKLMQAIDAKLIFEPDFKILMAYLPCMINGAHIGGIRARLEKQQDQVSYYNVKGSWTAEQGLFPYDYVKAFLNRTGLKTIVPVEGPRDALRSLCFGIPALAILGTGNWTEAKAELIFNLGVKRVITAFDPDAAGLKATKNVNTTLGEELTVRRFNFEPYIKALEKRQGGPIRGGLDPGNMPAWIAKDLKTAVYRE